jgi:hypothetical protein
MFILKADVSLLKTCFHDKPAAGQKQGEIAAKKPAAAGNCLLQKS